eukprot:gene21316-27346_t
MLWDRYLHQGCAVIVASACFPCVYQFISVWVPANEKTLMIPTIMSGMYLGEIIGFSLSGVLVESQIMLNGSNVGGWPSVFYIFGLMGIVWFPLWACWAHEKPSVHPTITADELLLFDMKTVDNNVSPSSRHTNGARKGGGLRPTARYASLSDESTHTGMTTDDLGDDDRHVQNALHGDCEWECGVGSASMNCSIDGGDLSSSQGGDHHSEAGATTTYTGLHRNETDVNAADLGALAPLEIDHTSTTALTVSGESPPWLQFIFHPVAFAMLLNNWMFGWIGFTLLSEMPSYLTDVLGFNLQSAGLLSVVPYLVLFASSLGFGALFNHLERRGGWSVRDVRQCAQFVSVGGAAVALLVCGFVTNRYVAYTCMILAQFFYGAIICGVACSYLEVSPRYSTNFNTIHNTAGAVAGILGPIIVAALTEAHPGSSFYWGYALGQIPGSRLAQQYGAKWIFGFSVLIPSFLTLFVPMAARDSLFSTLVIRMMIGFFESATFPCVYHYIPIWIPIDEKTFMIPAVLSGMYLGEIIGFSLSGVLVGSDITIGDKFYGGWPSVFYVFGLVGLVWFPFWAYLAYESPEKHPTITKEELLLLRKGKHLGSLREYEHLDGLIDHKQEISSDNATIVQNVLHGSDNGENDVDEENPHVLTQKGGGYASLLDQQERSDQRTVSQISDDGHRAEVAARTPWATFFTHPVSLTLFLNSWTAGWIGFTLLSEMPSYLTDVLGFNLESAGILSVFPFLALFISSLLFGKFFNYLQLHYGWKVRTVRHTAQYISIAGSSLSLLICAYLTDKYVAYCFMILSLFCYGATVASLACAYSDMSPNYSPIMNTIGNTIGAVAGIVGPLVVAAFTDAYPGIAGWRAAFYLTCAMSAVSLVAWSVWQTSEIVPVLNSPRPHNQ